MKIRQEIVKGKRRIIVISQASGESKVEQAIDYIMRDKYERIGKDANCQS